MKDYDVICVGFVVQDIVMEGIDSNAFQKDSTYADNITISTGGDAANQAVVLAQIGKKAALIAGFGRDTVGRQIEEQLNMAGVDTTYALREGIERSNLSVVVIKKDKDRSFLVGRGIGKLDVSFKDIELSLLEHTKAVSLGSLYFLKNLDGEGAACLFRSAKEKNVLTFADMTADAYGIGPEGVAAIYPYTDYLMPSYEEAVYTTKCTDYDDIADCFLRKGVQTVILKLGNKGCFVKNKTERFFINPYLIQPVDTTGCGDNFCAAFITGILEQMSLKQAAQFACAAGALNAGYMGACGGVKSRKQLEEFIKNTPISTKIW